MWLVVECKCLPTNLRLGIKGGGCSGLSYNMEFVSDEDYNDGDTILIFDEFEVYTQDKDNKILIIPFVGLGYTMILFLEILLKSDETGLILSFIPTGRWSEI